MPSVTAGKAECVFYFPFLTLQPLNYLTIRKNKTMLVVLDSILNRITQNRAKGRNTFIFIDEIYLLFQHEYSATLIRTK